MRVMNSKIALVLSVATGVVLSSGATAVATPSGAEKPPKLPSTGPSKFKNPKTAKYKGKSFDMTKGWGKAKSCVVKNGKVNCFDTNKEADKHADALLKSELGLAGFAALSKKVAERNRNLSLDGVPACASGWYCLYEHSYGGGDRLIFRDEYWQDLWDYGFKDKCSATRNNRGDGRYAAIANWTGSSWEYLYDSDGNTRNHLGNWNDKADFVYG